VGTAGSAKEAWERILGGRFDSQAEIVVASSDTGVGVAVELSHR